MSGIFARDSGTGAMGLTSFGKGNCYALLHACDSGSIRAGKYVDGAWTDFLTTPPTITASGWHRFRIDCYGSHIGYWLDGEALATVTDGSHARGYFGIGHHEFFATDANVHGARVDNFIARVAADAIVQADFDRDTDVDQVDFGHLQMCMSGTQVAQTLTDCQDARLDNDSDVDGNDLVIFLGCFSGPGVAADSSCVQP
jgi:hypothetical protein